MVALASLIDSGIVSPSSILRYLHSDPPLSEEWRNSGSVAAELTSLLEQMDGGVGSRVKVVGQVERVDGRSLTYPFMKPNITIVLSGLTSSWRSCEDWALAGPDDRRCPNLDFFVQNFPSPLVQGVHGSEAATMSMQEFIDQWAKNSCTCSSNGTEASLLYLKDWRFVKDKESWDLNNAEKTEAAGAKKEEGNALFRLCKYARASKRYEKAAKFIDYDTSFSEDEKKLFKQLKITCNLNNAACKLKLNTR